MESLPALVSVDDGQGSPDTSPDNPMTPINRAFLVVRQSMVLRVWGLSVLHEFPIMSEIENLGRTASLLEEAGVVPPGLAPRVLEACFAPDIEASRQEVVLWVKQEILDRVLPLAGDLKPMQLGLLVNSAYDAACLLFEFSLLTRLAYVMRSNASLTDPVRKRRLVKPKFVGADGAVLKVADDYRKGDPEVVLAEALVKKKELAGQIAWARRRKVLASKGLIPSGGKPMHAAFSLAAFDRLVARWGSLFDAAQRSFPKAAPFEPPGAVPDTADKPPAV